VKGPLCAFLTRGFRTMAVLLLTGCATGTTTTPARPEVVPSHIYPFPLDTVLAQVAPVFVKKGWRVQRSGDVLLTNWVGGEVQSDDGTDNRVVVGYRVFGERVDAGYCTIRVERLVATPSTLDFGQKKGGHVVSYGVSSPGTAGAAPGTSGRNPAPVHNLQRELMPAFRDSEFLPEFSEDAANEAVATGLPSGVVVTQYGRDAALEGELQELIDPRVVAPAEQTETAPVAVALVDAGVLAPPDQASAPVGVKPPPASDKPSTALAGIWDGTFTFRGSVTGSFSGELTVAVDAQTVEVADFCPEGGGTLTAQSSSKAVAWRGELACPPIRMKGCPSAKFTYSSVNATVSERTLTVTAAGTVDADVRCSDRDGILGGDLSVTFVAQKADYVHIAVTKAQRATTCVWPSNWEDFSSVGSMAIPDGALDDASYLGIIRAKGGRLTEIQRLLRHCHQVVLLHGKAVLMRLAVTRSRM
jgi:hypothetical protein